MEMWGAGVAATALEAGLLGVCLILAVAILRPDPRWAAALLLLGLAGFVVPRVVRLPLPRPASAARSPDGEADPGTGRGRPERPRT